MPFFFSDFAPFFSTDPSPCFSSDFVSLWGLLVTVSKIGKSSSSGSRSFAGLTGRLWELVAVSPTAGLVRCWGWLTDKSLPWWSIFASDFKMAWFSPFGRGVTSVSPLIPWPLSAVSALLAFLLFTPSLLSGVAFAPSFDTFVLSFGVSTPLFFFISLSFSFSSSTTGNLNCDSWPGTGVSDLWGLAVAFSTIWFNLSRSSFFNCEVRLLRLWTLFCPVRLRVVPALISFRRLSITHVSSLGSSGSSVGASPLAASFLRLASSAAFLASSLFLRFSSSCRLWSFSCIKTNEPMLPLSVNPSLYFHFRFWKHTMCKHSSSPQKDYFVSDSHPTHM